MKNELVRKNIYMSQKLGDWIVEEAKRTGNSQSSVIVNALQFYVDYKKSLEGMEQVKILMEKVEELERKTQ